MTACGMPRGARAIRFILNLVGTPAAPLRCSMPRFTA
jgi:hypothetical protein